MKRPYLSFTKFVINEDRREDIFNYENDVVNVKKAEVLRIKAKERESIEENVPQGFAFLNEFDELVKSIEKNEKNFIKYQSAYKTDELKMMEMFDNIFDQLDESKTRYIETKYATVSLSKVGEGKTTTDYKKAYEMLKEVLKDSAEVQEKIEAAIEKAKVTTIDYEKLIKNLETELPDNSDDIKKALDDNSKTGNPRKPTYNTIRKERNLPGRVAPGAFDNERDAVTITRAEDERVEEGIMSRIKDSGKDILNRVSEWLSSFTEDVKNLLFGIDRKLNRINSLMIGRAHV